MVKFGEREREKSRTLKVDRELVDITVFTELSGGWREREKNVIFCARSSPLCPCMLAVNFRGGIPRKALRPSHV